MMLGAYPKIYPEAKAPLPDLSEVSDDKSARAGTVDGRSEVADVKTVVAPDKPRESAVVVDAAKTRTIEDRADEQQQIAIADQSRSEALRDTLVFKANLADLPG